MRMIGLGPALLLLLSLGGCGSSDDGDASGLAPGEARALNDAAAELDARNHPPQDDAGINPAAMSAARARREQTGP